MRRAALVAVLALALAAPAAVAAPQLVKVGDFTQPVFVTAPPLDTARVLIVERRGTVVLLKDGVRQSTLFLDARSLVESGYDEQGLLSLAFAPDYATSRKMYAFYTAKAPLDALQVDELTVDASGDHVDPATRRSIITVAHDQQQNHDGGQLQIGPDGLLWIGTGDGGGGGDPFRTGQDKDALLAKLLRIDPRPGSGCGGGCTIPLDNPFVGGAGASEVWAYGLRNPWRFSFDRQSHDLWIGDVGQNCFEEIDRAPAPGLGRGGNYEWSVIEGNRRYPPSNCQASPVSADQHIGIAPVLDYAHENGRQSVTGGYVVRDPNLPSLSGRYVYGDFSTGEVWSLSSTAPDQPRDDATVSTLSSFGEDGCARLYAASVYGNVVYRFAENVAGGGACAGPSQPVFTIPGQEPVPPGGGGGGATADTTAPALTLRATKRQRPWRSGVLHVSAQCDEICTVVASGRFRIAGAARKAAAAPLRTRAARATLAERAKVSLRLRVTKATRKRLRTALGRHRRVTVRFTVAATDAAGNRRVVVRDARIVR